MLYIYVSVSVKLGKTFIHEKAISTKIAGLDVIEIVPELPLLFLIT